jgi:starch phosphorylase
MDEATRIAYFSMEVGIDPRIPTYSGGLGILAGDTIRSAADLGIPMIAVTLLHRKGYFQQHIDASGWQHEDPVDWVIEDHLEELDPRIPVMIAGREVRLRAWRRDVVGLRGHVVPLLFLDSDLPENEAGDRSLTDYLYGGDHHYRLCQEVILGIGGIRMLRALGLDGLQRYHLNEGHASLLALELLEERLHSARRDQVTIIDIEEVREKCVFTTHTPVPAGHDQFPLDMVRQVLGADKVERLRQIGNWDGTLNMTYLALSLSHYVNGVAKRHAEVSNQLFARYSVDSITNGVHAVNWTSPPFQRLFDEYISSWRSANSSLRYAESIPRPRVWQAHCEVKQQLIDHVTQKHDVPMDNELFTIGFARRAATYKRADLFFHDLERVRRIARDVGGLQIIYGGKAHPRDDEGKRVIQRIHHAIKSLGSDVRVCYVENYDIELGRLLTTGVDLWLNNPRPPLEASGTSGMKSALNGVPSLSILDGWWIEGCIEGVTGWAIDGVGDAAVRDDAHDAACLYDKLETVIMPLYYEDRDRYIDIMRHCIAINGSFFNTERMMHEYVLKAYFL